MKDTHAQVLTEFYALLQKNKVSEALALCSPKFSFQIAGNSALAGKFDATSFAEKFISLQKKLSAESYQFEIHDVLASDLHGTVLGTVKFSREGQTHELRTVHVWRFESGKPLAGYEYARDLYQSDRAWGA